MIEAIDRELAPLDRALSLFAPSARLPGADRTAVRRRASDRNRDRR
jgi:hypothetical protein